MLKKALKLAGIGFLIGVVIGYTVSFLTGLGDPSVIFPVSEKLLRLSGGTAAAILLQGLCSGLYGAVCFAAVLFYDIESWPLALATGAHCAVIILVFPLVGMFLGWENSITELFVIAGIQLVCFFIIWLIMCFVYKKQVKELNDMQKDFSDHK